VLERFGLVFNGSTFRPAATLENAQSFRYGGEGNNPVSGTSLAGAAIMWTDTDSVVLALPDHASHGRAMSTA
jgi:hypothetical protein